MPAKKLVVASLLLLFSVFSLNLAAFAQGAEAVLAGTVTDPNDAVITQVQVVAQNTATGVVSSTLTNDAGLYRFPSLPPGVYRISVEHTGFKKLVLDKVTLEVGARRNLNLALSIGTLQEEAVQIVANSSDTQLGVLTSSVGSVITGRKILELPLAGRQAFDLIATQAGVGGTSNPASAQANSNFSGARAGALNVTLDGFNVQDNFFNGLGFTNTANTINVDRIEEFRIVTSPADVELGRGSGQVIMLSRSGTNQFHGSLFEENRNTALTSNTFFNNQRGAPRDPLVRNQYGGRIGGPIRKNKTFFHFHYEGMRQRSAVLQNMIVYTDAARRGIYRFFPGVRNANATAAVPTVDSNGNPVKPSTATGDLQSVNVFGRDPVASVPDQSGNVARLLGLMPLPNNFRFGDGLNYAGYTWSAPQAINFSQWDVHLDHIISTNHRLSFTYSRQTYNSSNVVGIQPWPSADIPPGQAPTNTNQAGLMLTSSLRPNLINEFRAGFNRPQVRILSPFDISQKFIGHTSAGQPFLMGMFLGGMSTPFAGTNFGSESNFRSTPVYQIGDNVLWSKGNHAFKGGFEARFISYSGFDTFAAMPRASLFQGGAYNIQNIASIAGIGNNGAFASQMLAELAGLVGDTFQTINAPGQNSNYLLGQTRYRAYRQPEFSGFFKDDWRIKPNLTLNIGVRYDWFAVPYEAEGRGVDFVGGGTSIFGISGNSFASEFQPGLANGSLASWQAIGPGTPNPHKKLWGNDNNNFAPAVGLSWSLPWFGKDKTVLRAGFGMGYERNQLFLVSTQGFGESGLSSTRVQTLGRTLLKDYSLPLVPSAPPYAAPPLTDRSSPTYAFDPHLRTPYYMNWNLAIQRQIGKSVIFEARYVGNRGRKLIRNLDVNEVNIFENGFLDAFNQTRSGGNSALLDRMWMGIFGVNGTTFTGSQLLRGFFPNVQGFLANNNVGGFANYLNSQALFGPFPVPGGLLTNGNLPQNFFVVNPQFQSAFFTSNYGSSAYDALQLEVVKRFSSGVTFQGNYTFSKALGDDEGQEVGERGYSTTIRNRTLDKHLLNFNQTHAWRMNGIYELPFGPGKKLLGKTNRVVGNIIGGWQLGGIAQILSGQPLNLNAINAVNLVIAAGVSPTTPGTATPVVLGAFPRNTGSVTRVGDGVVFFPGFQVVPDTSVATRGLAPSLLGFSTMLAVKDAAGNFILVNPLPGQFGSLAHNYLTGPGFFRLDLNLLKRIKIKEGKELILRADAVNATNTPAFSPPNTNINSLNFGRISSVLPNSNRVITISARFQF